MALDKIVAALSWVFGQLPLLGAWLGYNQLLIYQPSIYEGHELFFIGPIVVGIFATWIAFNFNRSGMIVIFCTFLVLFVIVFFIYDYFPPDAKVHTYNFFLFYCLPALGFALLGRLVVELANYVHPVKIPARFVRDFGDAVNTSYDIDHNLDTLDIIVCVRQTSGACADYPPTRIERPSSNSIRITCGSAPGLNALRVMVHA